MIIEDNVEHLTLICIIFYIKIMLQKDALLVNFKAFILV